MLTYFRSISRQATLDQIKHNQLPNNLPNNLTVLPPPHDDLNKGYPYNLWLTIGFLSEPNQEITLAIANPMEIFPVFKKFKNERLYLLDKNGMVLAHSQNNYIGANFKRIFQTLRSGNAGNFLAMDQLPVQATYKQIGPLPLWIVMEQTLPFAEKSWLKPTGQTLAIIGFWLFGIGFLIFTKSPIKPTQENELLTIQEELKKLRISKKQFELLISHETEAMHLSDPQQIALHLTKNAAYLCDSPVLFFAFHENKQTASLLANSGFPTPPSLEPFMITKVEHRKMINLAKQHQIPSLAQYTPLCDLILMNLNVAHFEAWAITTHSPLLRKSEDPKLLGILVILHAGIESNLHHGVLSRMIKTTGMLL